MSDTKTLKKRIIEEEKELSFSYKGQNITMSQLSDALSMQESSGGKNTKPRYESNYHKNMLESYKTKDWVPTPSEKRIIEERGFDTATKDFSTSRGVYQIIPETAYRYTDFKGNPEDLDNPAVSEKVKDQLIKRIHAKGKGKLEDSIKYWNENDWYLPQLERYLPKKSEEKNKFDMSSLNPFKVGEAEAAEAKVLKRRIVNDDASIVTPNNKILKRRDLESDVIDRTKKIFAESAKAVARGVEFSGSGIGAMAQWLGENIESGAEQDIWPGGIKKTPKEIAVQDKIGKTITKWGKTAYEFWQTEAMKGIESPDPALFKGSFMENPSWTRGVATVAQAIPSLATAAAVTYATQSPFAGAASLGLLEGSGQYVEARQADKDVQFSNVVGGLSTIGNSLLEVIPLTRFFRGGSKKLVKDIFIGGVQEGGEEVAQAFWSNIIAKIGYDRTRNLTEGMVEGFIGGAGSGGVLGGLTSGRGLQIDKMVQEVQEQGVSPQEIEVMQETVKNQIIDNAEKIDEILDDSAEKVAKPEKIAIPEQFTNPNDPKLLNYLGEYIEPIEIARMSGSRRLELANGPWENLRDFKVVEPTVEEKSEIEIPEATQEEWDISPEGQEFIKLTDEEAELKKKRPITKEIQEKLLEINTRQGVLEEQFIEKMKEKVTKPEAQPIEKEVKSEKKPTLPIAPKVSEIAPKITSTKGKWSYGAEPTAAIPGEPIAFYDIKNEDFNTAKAQIIYDEVDNEPAGYKIQLKNGDILPNPKSDKLGGSPYFETLEDAQKYAEQKLSASTEGKGKTFKQIIKKVEVIVPEHDLTDDDFWGEEIAKLVKDPRNPTQIEWAKLDKLYKKFMDSEKYDEWDNAKKIAEKIAIERGNIKLGRKEVKGEKETTETKAERVSQEAINKATLKIPDTIEAKSIMLYDKKYNTLKPAEKKRVLLDVGKQVFVTDENEAISLADNYKGYTKENEGRSNALLNPKTDFVTDGRYLIIDKEVSKEIKSDFWENEKQIYIKGSQKGGVSYKEAVKNADELILERQKDVQSPDIKSIVKNARENATKPLEFIGLKTSDMMNPLSVYSDGEKHYVLDSKYVKFFKRHFPNAVFKGEAPDKQIGIYVKEELKGIVLPMQSEEMDLPLTKVEQKSSIEADIKEEISKQRIIEEKKIKGKPRVKSISSLPKSPSGSGLAMAGVWKNEVPIEMGNDVYRLNPVEFPELVSIAKDLTGAYPGLRKFPVAGGMFYGKGKGFIKLHPQLFTRGNEQHLAITLAHEIGHLTDYLPDRFLSRGNLIGRLYSLSKFMKNTYGETDVKDKEIRKELLEITQILHPYNEDEVPASYKSYRRSSKELYAEAISMLLNSPGTMERVAPKFTKTFFDNLDKKLEVKEAYFAIQELLGGKGKGILYKRETDIRKMFVKGQALRQQMLDEKKLRKSNMWEHVRQYVDDINRPILKKIQDNEAKGIPDTSNLKYELQEQSMADIENHLMLADFDKNVLHPLEETGLTLDDLGEYVFLKRIIGQPDIKTEDIPEYEKYDAKELEDIKKNVEQWTDRKDIPNPLGFAPKTSQQQLDYLRNQIGDVKYARLESLAQELHNMVFKSVEEAVRVGAYNQKVFDERIAPNKDSYVSFGALNYLQNYVPATVKMQKGTLSEIENPIVTTILKTIALNRLNAKQRALNAFRDTWQKQFPKEIKLSKVVHLDKGITRLIEARPGSGFGTVKLMENGKLVGYDVDQYIAEAFDKSKSGDMQLAMMLNHVLQNQVFKNLYITYNPGFAFAFNPIRDFKRTYINLKALGQDITVKKLLIEYAKNMPEAIKRQMGVSEGITREMMEVKALDVPFIDFNYDIQNDSYSGVLKSLKMVEGEDPVKWKEVGKKVFTPIVKVLEAMRFGGSVLESLSKISGYSVMKEANVSDKEKAYITRNYIGTPNYRIGGKITQTTNTIWMFSNIFKEGFKTDLRLATNPSTRGGWWMANLKVNILPKFLMWSAASGLMGGLLKELYDKIPEYDKTNYIIIPLGLRKDGRANYVRLPIDESGRLLTGLMWKVLNGLKDKELKDVQQVLAFGAGQLPGPAPVISMGMNWMQYLTGKNPYDNFKGRYLISETAWKAGGWPTLKKMIQWTFNQSGLSQFATYDDKRNETFDYVLQLTPVINRLIKSSDFGITQKLREIREELQQESAQKTLRKKEAFDRNVERFNKGEEVLPILRDIKLEVYGNEAISKRQLTDLKKGFIKSLLKEEGNPYIDATINAVSNEEKAQILLEMKEFKTAPEFGNVLHDLLKFKIISNDVIMLIKKGVTQ